MNNFNQVLIIVTNFDLLRLTSSKMSQNSQKLEIIKSRLFKHVQVKVHQLNLHVVSLVHLRVR